MALPPTQPEEFASVPPARQKRLSLDAWLFALVAATALGCAILLYLRFLGSPRLLWNDTIHDRNAHLYSGMCLAMDVRLGDIRHLFADLDSFRTWPPFHDGLLVGTALLLGSGDERWAVLPSLMAWIGSAVYAFLLARRCSSNAGSVAGILAALFVLVSPALRAYATDVMIESLGAALSIACLYYYVAAEQDRTPRAYRAVALSLTLLFFTKYNYWLLVALGTIADRIAADPKRPIAWLGERLKAASQGDWLAAQVRRSSNYFVLLILVVGAALALSGGVQLSVLGRSVSVRPSPNLFTIVYAVCFLRLVPWYRRKGRAMVMQSGTGLRELVQWHVWPIALWFWWPHRLYSFLWVLDPASNAGEHPRHDLIGGYEYYWNAIATDFHVGYWSAAIAAGLALFAFRLGIQKRLRPGATAVLWFIAIALLLTIHHQNRKSRFLHSWVPLVWVAAGVGAAGLAPKRQKGKVSAAWICFASGACAFTLPHLPGLTAPAHAPEGGIHPPARSTLDVTDAYLPDLAESRHAAVFSNMPMKHLAQWTYLKRYHRKQRLETDVKGFDPTSADNRSCLSQWAAATDCDTIVYADFPPGSAFYAEVPGCETLPQYLTMMETQSRFALVRRQSIPRYGCTVSVWKRLNGANP